jgi:nitrogen PTS system EIIA component
MTDFNAPRFEPRCVMYVRHTSKSAIIRELAKALEGEGVPIAERIPSVEHEAVVAALLERESIGPTGVGGGVALPHAKHTAVPTFVSAIGFLREGIPWESPDNAPVTTVMLCVSPLGNPAVYLGHMAAAVRAVRDPETIKRWRQMMG